MILIGGLEVSERRQPTHKEIMTKWWKANDGEWIKCIKYIPNKEDPIYSIYGFITLEDNPTKEPIFETCKDWFVGRESADIPPEHNS